MFVTHLICYIFDKNRIDIYHTSDIGGGWMNSAGCNEGQQNKFFSTFGRCLLHYVTCGLLHV